MQRWRVARGARKPPRSRQRARRSPQPVPPRSARLLPAESASWPRAASFRPPPKPVRGWRRGIAPLSPCLWTRSRARSPTPSSATSGARSRSPTESTTTTQQRCSRQVRWKPSELAGAFASPSSSPGLFAYTVLHYKLKASPGETLLLFGAASPEGRVLAQLAAVHQLRVFAVARWAAAPTHREGAETPSSPLRTPCHPPLAAPGTRTRP